MIDKERWLYFRALVWGLQCGRLSRWTRRVTVLVVMLVVALVGGLALAQDAPPPGPSGPQEPRAFQQTIKGDTVAWAEIEAAYKKLDSLSGYRKKYSGLGVLGWSRVDSTFEIVPPNSSHVISESPPSSLFGVATPATVNESVTVNGQTRWRTKQASEPWGPWQCLKARPPADTRGVSLQATIEASRGPDTAIEGMPVRTYVYTIVSTLTLRDKSQSTGMVKTTLYVDTQRGLPRREVEVITRNSDKRELPPSTTDYYDYDAKIEITLPPCEKEI